MSDDRSYGVVHTIDTLTGYPMDKQGHLLNPISDRDGAVIKDWGHPGTKLASFTSPYGHLHFAVGSGDDFYCFDYATVNAGPRGEFLVLHSTLNSETGSFIQDCGYRVMPCNTTAERKAGAKHALLMVDVALDWAGENDVKHTISGWNQKPYYFAFCVADNVGLYDLPPMPGDLQRRRYSAKQLEKLEQFLNVKEPA